MKTTTKTIPCGFGRIFAKIPAFARAAALAAAFVAMPAMADVVTWNGAAGAQDWTLGSNWSTGSAPASGDTALFPNRNNPKYVFSVTPPADFVGTVTATNYATGDSAAYSSRHFDVVLELGVVDGASWKVDGTAAIVATDGLAARIAPTFAGTIDVRKGTTFTLPSTLNAGVTVVGAGKVVLASTAQLPQVALFAGEVVLPSGSVAASAASAFAASATELADGQTVSFAESSLAYNHTGSISAPAADSWSMNGGVWDGTDLGGLTPSAAPPHLDADGSLLLTDDPAQCHSAWYTNRTFRTTDDWGMSFTWTPELPNPSAVTQAGRGQTLSGNFGIVFQRVGATEANVARNDNRRTRHAGHAWGFFLSTYRDNQQGVSWTCDGVPGWEGTINRRVLEPQLGGVMLNKAIDFTVAMVGGKMAVTMVQGDKSCTFVWNFKTAATVFCPGGYWVGFTGSSDDWGTNATIPWSRQRIADFSGWYRDPLDGGWEDVSATAFSPSVASNWEYMSADKNNGDAAYAGVNPDGSFQLINAPSNGVYLISKTSVPIGSRLKMSFALQGGAASLPAASGMGLGFMLGGANTVTRKLGDWNATSGYPYSSWAGDWVYGFGFMWGLSGGGAYFTTSRLGQNGPDGTVYSDTSFKASDMSRREAANPTIGMDFVYDPSGWIHGFFSHAPGSASLLGDCTNYKWNLNAAQKTNLEWWKANRANSTKVGIRAASGARDYIELKLTDVSVKSMTSLQGGRIPGALRVPAGAAATVVAGEAMSGQTAPVMVASSLELADGAALSVAPETASTIFEAEKAIVAGRATLAPASGASLLVDSLVLDGTAGQTALVATGASFPSDVVVAIPDAWTRSPQKAVGRHEIVRAAGFPVTARVVTESGEDVTDAAHLAVDASGSATIDFTTGFVMVIR